MTSTSDLLSRRSEALDEKFAKAERLGKPHLVRLASEIRALALAGGSYVVVDVDTGEYVTGPSRREARVAFRAKHPGALNGKK